MEIGWTDVGSGGYILVSSVHTNTNSECVLVCFQLNFIIDVNTE